LRLGWINAEPEIIGRLTALGYVHSGGGVNHATAVTMAEFRDRGDYQRHLVMIRREYRTQRNALADALRKHVAGVVPPAGGWFLWVPLPAGVDADGLLPVAEERGVSFVPGTRFWADGSGGRDRIRLSFSHLPADDLERAAERLAGAIAATAPAPPGPGRR
jgi:2-aminoadipate transaminase